MSQVDPKLFSSQLSRLGATIPPTLHVVLGSGFGKAVDGELAGWKCHGNFSFRDAGLLATTVTDHRGEFRLFSRNGRSVLFQIGRLHGYEGHPAREAVAPVMLARQAGIANFLLTNAAGGIDPAHRLGDVLVIRDHVNFTGQNPLVGKNPDGGPRFPDMSEPYDRAWGKTLATALTGVGVTVHEGTYVGVLGPSFETPAEIALFGRLGIHAVGMSTVWETIALRHSGARVGGLSLISNAACGLGDGAPLDHEAILKQCRSTARKIVDGIVAWLEKEPLP